MTKQRNTVKRSAWREDSDAADLLPTAANGEAHEFAADESDEENEAGFAGPTHASIGAKIRELRAIAGMSQAVLGGALGVTFQQIQKYERGVNKVSAVRMCQIAKVLNCGVGDILGEPVVTTTDGVESNAGALRLLGYYRRLSRGQQGAVRILLASMAGDDIGSASEVGIHG